MNPTNTGMLGNIQPGAGNPGIVPPGYAGQAGGAPVMGGQVGNIQPQQSSNFAQRFSQLHPMAQQALRGMPPQMMQHLHDTGMIHPEMMGHIQGSNANPMVSPQ